MIGRENLKLSTSQVSNMVTLLRKEAELEGEEKFKIKMEKEESKEKSQDIESKDSSPIDSEFKDDSMKVSEPEVEKASETVEEQEKIKSEEKSS